MGNRLLFPPMDGQLDPSWTTPLEMVHRALLGSAHMLSDEFFTPSDFMIMSRIVRTGRPDIQLYKHIYTRRYINVDQSGHTYRYLPPRDLSSKRSGSYRPHRSLRKAVEDLRLWELPWMKPGLESHRGGVTWEDRWRRRDYDTGDLLSE
jgi:hypothetical protein